ncbi:MAG: pur operon repressor [Halanaerobium sp.]|nr:pur operon repressor [Halanaerobium sp.]
MRLSRSQRISFLTKLLTENPFQLFSITEFGKRLGVSKSTISEDISLIRDVFASKQEGKVETFTGASGGVWYVPELSSGAIRNKLEELCLELKKTERILPGDFLYLTDIIFSPDWAWNLGVIFASKILPRRPDYLMTMETKGIPLAMMTARVLNCPLVTVRKSKRITEGSVVSINYVSGSSGKIETMFLSRRAFKKDSSVFIIDDFMRAGGTARGMRDLVKEFEAKLLGIGVLVATAEPEQKLVDDYFSLLQLKKVDQRKGIIDIRPGEWIDSRDQ